MFIQKQPRGVIMKFYRINDLVPLTGLSRSTIYRLVEKGEFPKPVKLSARVVGWEEDAVLHWKASIIGSDTREVVTGNE
jgi:prophage regulatory protein